MMKNKSEIIRISANNKNSEISKYIKLNNEMGYYLISTSIVDVYKTDRDTSILYIDILFSWEVR